MKKGLVYFLGVLTGAVLTIAIFYVLGLRMQNSNAQQNPQIFAQAGEAMNLRSFQVFQVLPDGCALAKAVEKADTNDSFDFLGLIEPAITVLLIPVANKVYYDKMVINVSKEKIIRHIGTYRYTSTSGEILTVPVVAPYDE